MAARTPDAFFPQRIRDGVHHYPSLCLFVELHFPRQRLCALLSMPPAVNSWRIGATIPRIHLFSSK